MIDDVHVKTSSQDISQAYLSKPATSMPQTRVKHMKECTFQIMSRITKYKHEEIRQQGVTRYF